MPTYIINAVQINSLSASLAGGMLVQYTRGFMDSAGTYTPMPGESTLQLSIPIEASGVLATAQQLINALAKQENLDLTKGDIVL